MRFWESKWLAQVYTVEEDGHFLNQKMDILIPKLHTLIKKDQFTLSIKVTNRLCDIRYTCTIWILLLGFYEGKGGRQCLKYKGMGSKTARGFSSIQSLSRVWLFVTPWPAAHQASLSITNSRSLLKLMSVEPVMPSNHLILCRPLLLPPSIFPSISLFKWVSSSHQEAKILELQHQSFQWLFRTDFL